MGVIQGSINQLLSTAGIAARLSPDFEIKQTLAKENAFSKQLEAVAEEAREDKRYEQVAEKIESQQLQSAEKIAQLSPTKENVKKYLDTAEGLEEQKKAEQEAQKALRIKQEEQRKSKDFRQMFTEGGKWK